MLGDQEYVQKTFKRCDEIDQDKIFSEMTEANEFCDKKSTCHAITTNTTECNGNFQVCIGKPNHVIDQWKHECVFEKGTDPNFITFPK